MKRILWLLPLPAALLIRWIVSGRPDLVERIFSTNVWPTVAAPVGSFMSLIPFSVIEILLVLYLGFVLYSFFKKRFFRVLVTACMIAAVFVAGFGLNYLRQPLEITLGLTVRNAEASELAALCDRLTDDANLLYRQPPDDMKRDYTGAMNAAADQWPIPKGSYGGPKAAFISPVMSRLMFAGVTSPWTLEPLVNGGIPRASYPYVALHEMAHVRGFAREEDANLIAYLACAASGDAYIRYSGALSALMSCLDALKDADAGLYAVCYARLTDGPKADIAAHRAYWTPFAEEKTADVGAFFNNAYLSTVGNGDQSARSYGRVVDLLLALERTKGT